MGIDGTMMGQIRDWAASRPDDGALFQKAGHDGWDVVTWRDYWERVLAVGRGLIELGLQPGDSVAMIAENRPEWVIAQHGITAAGGIPCPIYTTNLVGQVAYIVDHSESRIVVLDTAEQLAKIRAAQREGSAGVERIVTMDDIDGSDDVITLAALEAIGVATDSGAIDARLAATAQDDVALRVYTSGTTGVPKGAEFTHANIAAVTDAIMGATEHVLEQSPQRGVSYLPLCHAAEQLFTNFVGTRLGGEYYFCPGLDHLREHLAAVHPTILLGVPRVWEKLEAAIRVQLGGGDDIDEATGKAVQAALGLDQVVFGVSGAAPISPSTLQFFERLGVVIHECYGMTETTGGATCQPFGKPRIGTVGRPMPGVEARVADDGELLLRGANMVRSYHKLPEQTAELWEDGWMHTGDLASIDDDGFITITGRAKDLLITAGGKNVGPVEMENHLVGIVGVGQAVAVGDRKPYLTALLSLEPETLPALLDVAGAPADLTPEQAAVDERVLDFLRSEVDAKCNARVARFQQIKYFEVLPAPFSVETGEMTPTMKIKRNVVTEKFADAIDGMYASAQPR